VPKDERKISNIVQINQENAEIMKALKEENQKLRTSLEEIMERGQAAMAAGNDGGNPLNFMN